MFLFARICISVCLFETLTYKHHFWYVGGCTAMKGQVARCSSLLYVKVIGSESRSHEQKSMSGCVCPVLLNTFTYKLHFCIFLTSGWRSSIRVTRSMLRSHNSNEIIYSWIHYLQLKGSLVGGLLNWCVHDWCKQMRAGKNSGKVFPQLCLWKG